MHILVSGPAVLFCNRIPARSADLRAVVTGNRAAVNLDKRLSSNRIRNSIAAVIGDRAAVHNELDALPGGLAADLNASARVARNLSTIHGDKRSVVHANT